MLIKDTLIVGLSDMHSGSTKALFPNRFIQFQHVNHTPTPEQRKIWEHFDYCAELVRLARKNKRLIVVHDGDAIEGVHHGSPQIVTNIKTEQVEIHTELMDHFLKKVGFRKGDALYYVSGTESHTKDNEQLCAIDLDAESNPNGIRDDSRVFDELYLTINGRKVWFIHHGPSAGNGANMGNALHNWLKNQYFNCKRDGDEPPHFIVTGHTHDPYYDVMSQREETDFHVMHGVILPSWQHKTRYAHQAAPVTKNKIGLMYCEIRADGEIMKPKIPWLNTERDHIAT